jgi:hypothetical protein
MFVLNIVYGDIHGIPMENLLRETFTYNFQRI